MESNVLMYVEKMSIIQKKCSGLDDYSANVLNENSMLQFICDGCMQYKYNVDFVLNYIRKVVNKTVNILGPPSNVFSSTSAYFVNGNI